MTQAPIKLPDSGPKTKVLPDGRLSAPSAERNGAPIFDRLAAFVPTQGGVLEIASGTGQHISALAAQHPNIKWHPSDVSDQRMNSVRAWCDHVGVTNVNAPLLLDASGRWPRLDDLGLIYVVNLFHLISTKDARAVIKGAAAALSQGGHFFVYGPFRTDGAFRSDGDAAFDASLRSQAASIGYKDLEWMQAEFQAHGLAPVLTDEMPANNLVLVGQKGE